MLYGRDSEVETLIKSIKKADFESPLVLFFKPRSYRSSSPALSQTAGTCFSFWIHRRDSRPQGGQRSACMFYSPLRLQLEGGESMWLPPTNWDDTIVRRIIKSINQLLGRRVFCLIVQNDSLTEAEWSSLIGVLAGGGKASYIFIHDACVFINGLKCGTCII